MNIQTTTIVTVGDKNYEMEYPKVKHVIEIENLKLMLSGNMYGDLMKSNHSTAVELLNLVDGVAYFSVLAPQFKIDFDTKNFTEMDVFKQKQITKAFTKVFWPWFLNINVELDKEDGQQTTN